MQQQSQINANNALNYSKLTSPLNKNCNLSSSNINNQHYAIQNNSYSELDNSKQFFSIEAGRNMVKPTITAKSRNSTITQSKSPVIQQSSNIENNDINSIIYLPNQDKQLLMCKQCKKLLNAVIQNHKHQDENTNICLECLQNNLYQQKQSQLENKIAQQQKNYIAAWNFLKGTLFFDQGYNCNCQQDPCVCGCNVNNNCKNKLQQNPQILTNNIEIHQHKVYPNALSKKYVIIDEYKLIDKEINQLLEEFPFLQGQEYVHKNKLNKDSDQSINILTTIQQDDFNPNRQINATINFSNIDHRPEKSSAETLQYIENQRFSQQWNKKTTMLQ